MTDAGLAVAIAEYERRSVQAQTAVTRVDFSLTLLTAGLALIVSVALGLFSTLYTKDRDQFWAGMSGLAGLAASFITLVLFRDFVARKQLTYAEKAQTRLRQYFVTKAPDVRRYLSDTIYDDWPTPYTHRKTSRTFAAWVVLIAAASASAGVAALSAGLAVARELNYLVAAVGLATFALTGTLLLTWLVRATAQVARTDIPRFPRPENDPQ